MSITAREPGNACFNTQPPEGGWGQRVVDNLHAVVSTHSRPKAAGGTYDDADLTCLVSTHSRPKAAGLSKRDYWYLRHCFNTQPPEGGWDPNSVDYTFDDAVSTHSRPKAAGYQVLLSCFGGRCFNTQPPEGGWWVLL